MVNIEVKTEELQRVLSNVSKKIEDLSPIFNLFVNEYREIVAANFESRGQIMEGKRWTPLTKQYLAWKQKNFPGKQMGVLTGSMYNAALNFKAESQPKDLIMTVTGEDYYYYFQERFTNPRAYFNKKDGTLPNIANRILLELFEREIQKAAE